MGFNPDYLKKIDFNRAARDRYGWNFYAIKEGDHAYHWKSTNGSARYGLDLSDAAIRQAGNGFVPVMIGGKAEDWRFLNFAQLNFKVIPVVLTTIDYIWDHNQIKTRVDNLKSYLVAGQEWLRQQIDRTFDMIQPIVYYAPNLTKARLDEWNRLMSEPNNPKRWDYFYGIRDEVKFLLGNNYNESTHKYWAFVLGGNNGSSTISPVAVTHSDVFNNRYDQFEYIQHTKRGDEADNVYASLHELLHSFGLDHPSPTQLNYEKSIMMTRRVSSNQDCILLDNEKQILLASPFLN